MHCFSASCMVVLILGSVLSSAQNSPAATPQLKILVLNFKTNRPIAGHRVELLLPCILQGNWPHRIKRKKTTKDGISGFKLSTPLPTNVCVVEDGMEQEFAISEVLRQGAVSYSYDHYARPLLWPLDKHPGELVVYTRRIKAWTKFKDGLLSFLAGP